MLAVAGLTSCAVSLQARAHLATSGRCAIPLDTPMEAASGVRVPLRDLLGDVTVVGLWGTFCAPCMDELPLLNALYQERDDGRRVRILTISLDSWDTAGPVAKRLGLTVPVYRDPGFAFARAIAPRDPGASSAPDEVARPPLPLLAYLNREGEAIVVFGHDPTMTTRAFLEKQARLLDRAFAGRLWQEPSR